MDSSVAGGRPVLLLRNGGVAEIRFNRPHVLNALDVATAQAFSEAVEAAMAATDIRVILLAGEGRAFMAGGDPGYFRDVPRAERPAASRRLIGTMNRAILALIEGPKPVVACIQGAAAGAGMSLALIADLAVAAEDARFNLSYAKIGVSPDCGGSFALVALVGARRAAEIALMCDTLDAARALELGLVNRVTPTSLARDEAMAIAGRLAEGAPLALAATRRLLRQASGGSLATQLEAELESFAALSATADFDAALTAFFDKSKPAFAGR